jgi:hypothetical protein
VAARHCTPAHDREQQRPAQPHRIQNTSTAVAVAVGSYTTAVRHCDCDMQDHTATRVALVCSTDDQRPPPSPPTTQAQRNTAPPLQRSSNARVYAAQRDTQSRAINRKDNHTQRCAVTHQPQRDAVQRRTRDITNPQQHKKVAIQRYSALLSTGPAMNTQDAHRMTTCSQAQRAHHAHAD